MLHKENHIFIYCIDEQDADIDDTISRNNLITNIYKIDFSDYNIIQKCFQYRAIRIIFGYPSKMTNDTSSNIFGNWQR